MTDVRPAEAARDQDASAFTPILRLAWEEMPSLLAILFVDGEGECVDYVSSIDPYEARVAAAHGHVLLHMMTRSSEKLALGAADSLELSADLRELHVRRMSDEYVIVTLVSPGFDRLALRDTLERTMRALRAEAGLAPTSWQPPEHPLEVRVRTAVGWDYAPTAIEDSGTRVVIADVLGRWIEPAAGANGDDLVCFRVRTEGGQELTLIHDPDGDGWVARHG